MDNKEKLCKVYRELSKEERDLINNIKDQGAALLDLFDLSICGEGYAIDIAKSSIETGIMWAVKHVVRDMPNKK